LRECSGKKKKMCRGSLVPNHSLIMRPPPIPASKPVLNKFFNLAHKTAITGLLFATGYLAFEVVHGLYSMRQRRLNFEKGVDKMIDRRNRTAAASASDSANATQPENPPQKS